ncbi:hypothetical protein BGZ67_005560 [Mortierella alpina]|nr:hypothetical protein BGZ67_005560 [Mortierella alpina]
MSALTSIPSHIIGDAQEAGPTFQPSDFSFLSQLLHIVQKIESGEDAQEIATLATNLKNSFIKCQTILDHLPGADLSPDEQAKVLAEEMQVLERKKAQLAKYLSWQVFQHGSTEMIVKRESNDFGSNAMNIDSHTSSSAASVSPEVMEASSLGHELDKEDVIMETLDMAAIKNEDTDTGSSLAPHAHELQPPHLHTSLTSDLNSIQVHGSQGSHGTSGTQEPDML